MKRILPLTAGAMLACCAAWLLACGPFATDLEPMLRFWQQDVGLRFDYVLRFDASKRHPIHTGAPALTRASR